MDRLRAMETFVKVAKLGSFMRAATELRISRPLVSLHIQQLEDYLGVRLINRSRRHLSLTEVGTEYLTTCVAVLKQLEVDEAEISRFQASPRGQLRILATMSFANFELSSIVSAFSQDNPDLSVIVIGTQRSLSSPELAEHYDVAIFMEKPAEVSLRMTKIGEVSWITCASPKYLKEKGNLKLPKDLGGHNCITHRNLSPPGIWRYRQGSEALEVRVKGSFVSNSLIVMRSAAMSGLGVAMLPLYSVDNELQKGSLVSVLDDFQAPPRPIYAVYPHHAAPKKVSNFIDFTRKQLRANSAARSAGLKPRAGGKSLST